jgi:hypothetical protein
MRFLTHQDCVESLLRYLGTAPGDQALADIRSAIDQAYREVTNKHTWTYLYKQGRINTVGNYTDGTVSVVAAAQTATFSPGPLPSWAADGYLRIATAIYRPNVVLDPVTMTLLPMLSPAADIAATSFILYQDSYLLPPDFKQQDTALYENAFGGLTYLHPREWLFGERYVYQAGIPSAFTVTGDEKYPGRLVIRLMPSPVDARTLDFIYKRKPRDLSITSLISQGNCTVTAGSTALSGLGTAFSTNMVGSVLRIYNLARASSASSTQTPVAPMVHETLIVAAPDTLDLTMADPAPGNYSGVAYTISDPLDIEYDSMSTCTLRCCEMFIGMGRTLKDKPSARAQFQEALLTAKEADSRSFSRRWVGDHYRHRQRLKDMPRGPDMS